MGGHTAWRKRVAEGELAKGSGGAILRHRPRLGRKGKDLILNRKGHIGGGNPKKTKKKMKRGVEKDNGTDDCVMTTTRTMTAARNVFYTVAFFAFVAVILAAAAAGGGFVQEKSPGHDVRRFFISK